MPKTEIGKISTVIKCNNHIARITINFNLILQLESLLCVNATRMRSSVLWPGSAPITVERSCHQNNPKMPPLITKHGIDLQLSDIRCILAQSAQGSQLEPEFRHRLAIQTNQAKEWKAMVAEFEAQKQTIAPHETGH